METIGLPSIVLMENGALCAPMWRADAASDEALRPQAAIFGADAAYAAGMAQIQGGAGADQLRAAVLIGVEIFEREALGEGPRLHGLYRAQCAAFEVAHSLSADHPEDASALFGDAARCAEALDGLEAPDAEKAARVLANAAAASHALASIARARGDKSFKADLEKALEYGERAVQAIELRGALQAETFLILAEVSYELALTIEAPSEAAELLRAALGWTREAAEAPGANALMQAEAMQRGANYACVYGLYLRNEDFEAGIAALEGAVDLALAVADEPNLPMALRAPAFDTAIRTRQNVALLLKERDQHAARRHFEASSALGRRAASTPGLSGGRRAGFLYLAANAQLEHGILGQSLSSNEADSAALASLREARELAQAALEQPECPPDVEARAALTVCGVSGRLLRAQPTLGGRAELAIIEAFGRRAAQAEGAAQELRDTGARFAADAAARLSGDPPSS